MNTDSACYILVSGIDVQAKNSLRDQVNVLRDKEIPPCPSFPSEIDIVKKEIDIVKIDIVKKEM